MFRVTVLIVFAIEFIRINRVNKTKFLIIKWTTFLGNNVIILLFFYYPHLICKDFFDTFYIV